MKRLAVLIWFALATISWGKRIWSIVPSLTPERNASVSQVRFIPIRPPTPIRVNPKPN